MAKLKGKKVKGQITILKAIKYRGSMVYVRMIGIEIFEWLLIYKDEIYSSFMIISPKKGCTKLTQDEINQSAALAFTGAVATIDTKLKEEKGKK